MKIALPIWILPIVKIGQRSKADSNVSAFSKPHRFWSTKSKPNEPMATHRLFPQTFDKVKIGRLFR
jgi:hypothetical protein